MASSASTEAAWTKKVSEDNGQLLFCQPPQVVHASRVDQLKEIGANAYTVRPYTIHFGDPLEAEIPLPPSEI